MQVSSELALTLIKVRVVVPLNIIIGGNILPLAVQARTAVILRLSELVDRTQMDFSPIFSKHKKAPYQRKLEFRPYSIRSYEKSPFCRTWYTSCRNRAIFSSRSAGNI